MTDLLSHLVDAPLANIFILAGLAFLAIGTIGKITGKIEPNTTGRVMSALLGAALLIYGIYSHTVTDAQRNQATQGSVDTQSQGKPPQKPIKSGSEYLLSGIWKNANPQTRGITKLDVQPSGDLVSVHAWGACSPQDCDWGTVKGAVTAESASVTWDQSFVLRKMTLTTDSGRLRMVLDSVYRDKRPPQQAVEYFVKQ